MTMNKITFILPLHKLDKSMEKLLSKSFESVNNIDGNDDCTLLLVGPKTVIEKASKLYTKNNGKLEVKKVINDDTDIFTQINVAVNECNTDYFSVFEYDDTFATYWLKYTDEYISDYQEWESDVVLPIIETVNEEGNATAFANEIAWSRSFNEDLGFVSMDSLEGYSDFIVSGSFINTKKFKEVGGLKPSLGIVSWYEFLLRLRHNGGKIFVAPKVGYYHMLRDGSYFDDEINNMTPDKGKWLLETARHEYFFKNDRDKQYDDESDDEDNQ